MFKDDGLPRGWPCLAPAVQSGMHLTDSLAAENIKFVERAAFPLPLREEFR